MRFDSSLATPLDLNNLNSLITRNSGCDSISYGQIVLFYNARSRRETPPFYVESLITIIKGYEEERHYQGCQGWRDAYLAA
jgi:hypothetical protein